ncbi:MAG: sporulation integral membrane protein YtvI [Firmicutes bacterium]|nr:sporulation integral membrane protein YtvI [Bacillota bacterium]
MITGHLAPQIHEYIEYRSPLPRAQEVARPCICQVHWQARKTIHNQGVTNASSTGTIAPVVGYCCARSSFVGRCCGALLSVTWLFPYFLPFILAFVVAFFLNPIVRWLQQFHIPRAASSVLLMVVILAGGGALLFFLIGRLIGEISDLVIFLQSLLQEGSINTWINQLLQTIQRQSATWHIPPELVTQLTNALRNLLSFLTTQLGHFLGWLISLATSAPAFLFAFVVGLMATFFITRDFDHMRPFFARHLPKRTYRTASRVIGDLQGAIIGYVSAEAILITITGVQVLIGLLVMHNPYAFLLALIATILDILPVLGTGTLLIPWAGFAGLVQHHWSMAIGLLILYVWIVVVRDFLEPNLISHNVGLRPLPTLIAIYVGSRFWGLIGFILGPLLLLVGIALWHSGFFHDLWILVRDGEFSSDEAPPTPPPAPTAPP